MSLISTFVFRYIGSAIPQIYILHIVKMGEIWGGGGVINNKNGNFSIKSYAEAII